MMGMMGKMGPMGGGSDMMKKGMEMREKKMASGFNPQEMCRQMTSAVTKAAEMGSYATPEVRALFEDWVGEVENEIINFISQNGQSDPGMIAKKLHISEDSAVFFISRLVQQKKLKITGIELGEPAGATQSDETPAESQTDSQDEKECKT